MIFHIPIIIGVAVVWVAQFASLLHCSALVNTNSNEHMNVTTGAWGDYAEITFEKGEGNDANAQLEKEGGDAKAQFLPETNVGINDDQ